MSERAGSVPAAYWELTKPRLSFLSVLTSLAGYFCSAPTQPTDADFLSAVGITQHLSPNRRNGLTNLVGKIRAFGRLTAGS